MKKVFALMSIIGLLTFTNLNGVMAQDNAAQAGPLTAPSLKPPSLRNPKPSQLLWRRPNPSIRF